MWYIYTFILVLLLDVSSIIGSPRYKGLNSKIILLALVAALGLLSFIVPLLLFILAGLGLFGPSYIRTHAYLRQKQLKPFSLRLIQTLLLLVFVVAVLVVAFYIFGAMFAMDDFDYLISYLFLSYFLWTGWLLVQNISWFRQKRWLSRLAYGSLAFLVLFGNWAFRHNPSTLFHREVVTLKGRSRVYTGHQIFTLLKQVEEMIVLDIDSQFQDVHSVTFLSVRENGAYYQYRDGYDRFTCEVLINGHSKIDYNFTLSYSDQDYEPSYISSSGYSPKEMKLKVRKKALSTPQTIDDLKKPAYQDRLDNIKISYYLKDDIYKDEDRS